MVWQKKICHICHIITSEPNVKTDLDLTTGNSNQIQQNRRSKIGYDDHSAFMNCSTKQLT